MIKTVIAALALSVISFSAGWQVHAWKTGAEQTQVAKQETKRVEQAAAHEAKVVEQQTAATQKVEEKHLAAEVKIRTVYRTITKEVPVYVTPAVDADFAIPNGLVRVLDAAATGAPINPDTPAGPDAAASDYAASDVGAWASAWGEACNANALQLADLQAWVRDQQRIAQEQNTL